VKFKWRFWSGLTFAVVFVAWCVLSYVFMWPPVVRNIKWERRPPSTQNTCINNLRLIDGAINLWAFENKKSNGVPVTLDQIKPYLVLNYKGEIHGCPQGGNYSVTVAGTPPICSWGTNTDMTRVRVDDYYWDWATPHWTEHILRP
jgi:hypothetical protein